MSTGEKQATSGRQATRKQDVFDPEVGRRAFERLWPRLEALSAEELLPATAKVNLAATFVLGVHKELSQSSVRERLVAMPGLDQELYAELDSIAWAAWYAWTKWQDATALQSGVRVPAELFEQASERRARMLAVLDYHLGEEPSVLKTLDSVRSGIGYQDTASDLVRLSRLYEEHRATIESDAKHYRAEDAVGAQADAAAIVETLSEAKKDNEDWDDKLTRAWTLLNQAYGEVGGAVLWLERNHPNSADRFPSLYTVARPGGAGRRQSDGVDNGDDVDTAAESPSPVSTQAPTAEASSTLAQELRGKTPGAA